MSDDDLSLITIFLVCFSFIGVIGAFQSHAFGPFTAIVAGVGIGAAMTAISVALIIASRKWWFWFGGAVVVVIGFAHELFRAW